MFHLKPKPEAAEVGGPGDAGQAVDSSAMVTRRDLAVDGRVHLLQERHGLEVLPAAVHVGRPVLAGVVEVEHRGDRVDPDAVDVELRAPVERVGDQEVATSSAEVEDVGAPVQLLARRGSACSYSGVPSKRASAQSSLGKCAGTQSTITPMPAWCARSTR
jgi:hypothetical protein